MSPRKLRRRWTDLFGGAGPEGAIESLGLRAEKQAQRQAVLLEPAARHCLQPHALLDGNLFQPLIDGREAFAAMLAAIESASASIDLETYLWEQDATGRRFAEALSARARAGVRVRLVVDGAGAWTWTTSSLFSALLRAGAQVALFHPMGPWRRRWGWSVRDHRKLLVCDSRVAFTGGLNLGDEYAPLEQGGRGWHDLHARVEGPVVRSLQRLFDDAFRYASGERGRGWLKLREPRTHQHPSDLPASDARDPLPAAERAPPVDLLHANDPARPGAARLQALAVGRRRDRRFIQRHYQYAVSTARTQVSIFNAYFIPNKSWRRTLSRAARRGIRVRVLVPRANDIPAVHYASRFTYQALLDSGVRIFEYLPSMLHAKALVVDGNWCSIGSYNLDQRSLMYNWEIAVAGIAPDSCARLEALFESDLSKSREIDPLLWPKRGWLEKAKERFFYFFRLLL